jgi:hypothetical protein
MCGITPGPPVLLAAAVPHDVLIVHPAHLIAELLAHWYTARDGDRDGR